MTVLQGRSPLGWRIYKPGGCEDWLTQKFSLVLFLACLTVTTAAADDELPLIVFNAKTFTDTGNMVHIEGTLTGDGLAYKTIARRLPATKTCKNAWRIMLTRKAQVFSLGLPIAFDIRVWTTDRIVADLAA